MLQLGTFANHMYNDSKCGFRLQSWILSRNPRVANDETNSALRPSAYSYIITVIDFITR